MRRLLLVQPAQLLLKTVLDNTSSQEVTDYLRSAEKPPIGWYYWPLGEITPMYLAGFTEIAEDKWSQDEPESEATLGRSHSYTDLPEEPVAPEGSRLSFGSNLRPSVPGFAKGN